MHFQTILQIPIVQGMQSSVPIGWYMYTQLLVFPFHTQRLTQRLQNGYSKHLQEQLYLLFQCQYCSRDGEHQHMAQGTHSVTEVVFIEEMFPPKWEQICLNNITSAG